MKAILTVIGQDKVGIVYRVSQLMATHNVNILDVNQTIMDRYFTMIILVDTTEATVPFSDLQEACFVLAKEMNLSIRLQNEEIFKTMYNL